MLQMQIKSEFESPVPGGYGIEAAFFCLGFGSCPVAFSGASKVIPAARFPNVQTPDTALEG